jgi:hypothetical protein
MPNRITWRRDLLSQAESPNCINPAPLSAKKVQLTTRTPWSPAPCLRSSL